MTGDSPLQDRRRGLEEEFFARENRELLGRMRAKQSEQEQRDALREASGIADDVMLDCFLEMGLAAETVAALTLVPLVEVAWSDGTLDRKERETILASARERPGVGGGGLATSLLENWLDNRPDESLFKAWEGYARALADQMDEATKERFRGDILDLVHEVAEAAGGTLGIGRVSRAERETIARIEACLR